MKTLLAVIALTFAASTQAGAQQVNCASEWKRMSDVVASVTGAKLPSLGLIRQRADGGCTTNGITMSADRNLKVKADSLSWNGRDMERFVTEGLPPTAFDIQIKGITLVPTIGDPAFVYLQGIQARGRKIDVSVALNWDRETNIARVQDILISLPNDDYILIDATIEGVDLSTNASTNASLGTMGMTSANMTIRSSRIFQDYLLLPLGMALLDGHDDPDRRVTELKAEAQAALRKAPNSIVSAQSLTALSTLISELPDPSGILEIRQTATPGLGVARGMSMAMRQGRLESLDDLWSIYDGIRFDVTYKPL